MKPWGERDPHRLSTRSCPADDDNHDDDDDDDDGDADGDDGEC